MTQTCPNGCRDRLGAEAIAGLVGVLGGMGPRPTIDFMHKVLDATPANCELQAAFDVPMLHIADAALAELIEGSTT